MSIVKVGYFVTTMINDASTTFLRYDVRYHTHRGTTVDRKRFSFSLERESSYR